MSEATPLLGMAARGASKNPEESSYAAKPEVHIGELLPSITATTTTRGRQHPSDHGPS